MIKLRDLFKWERLGARAAKSMKSPRDGILVAARNLSQLNSSFRSDINLPPINGLAKSLGAREIYKYLVPTGLIKLYQCCGIDLSNFVDYTDCKSPAI